MVTLHAKKRENIDCTEISMKTATELPKVLIVWNYFEHKQERDDLWERVNIDDGKCKKRNRLENRECNREVKKFRYN